MPVFDACLEHSHRSVVQLIIGSVDMVCMGLCPAFFRRGILQIDSLLSFSKSLPT